MTRYVFLDRDSTLIEDRGYAHEISDCHLLPGVVEGLRRLRAAGFGLAIVTNQSGIGRGYFTREDFDRFQVVEGEKSQPARNGSSESQDHTVQKHLGITGRGGRVDEALELRSTEDRLPVPE